MFISVDVLQALSVTLGVANRVCCLSQCYCVVRLNLTEFSREELEIGYLKAGNKTKQKE